jgi:hypothetical protein
MMLQRNSLVKSASVSASNTKNIKLGLRPLRAVETEQPSTADESQKVRVVLVWWLASSFLLFATAVYDKWGCNKGFGWTHAA